MEPLGRAAAECEPLTPPGSAPRSQEREDDGRSKCGWDWFAGRIAAVFCFVFGVTILLFYLYRHNDPCRKSVFVKNSILDKEVVMERSVDPCEDFYSFTCARWKETIQAEHNYSSLFDEMELRNLHLLEFHLKCSSAADLNSWARFMKRTYHSCESGRRRPMDASRTVAFVRDLAAPLLEGDPRPGSLDEVLRRVHHRSLQIGLFSWDIGLDWNESRREIMQVLVISPPKDPKKRRYAFDPGQHSAEYVRDVLLLLGANEGTVGAISDKIIETNALLNGRREGRTATTNHKRRLTYQQLRDQLNFIDFKMYFDEIPVTDSTGVLLVEGEYFTWLGYVLEKYKKKESVAIRDFLIWSAIDFFIPYMPAEFARIRSRYAAADPNGASPGSLMCLHAVKRSMNFAASSFFLDKILGGESRTAIDEIVANVKASFRDFLNAVHARSGQGDHLWTERLEDVFGSVQIGVPDHLYGIYNENLPVDRFSDSFPDRYLFAMDFSKAKMLSYIEDGPLGVLFARDFLQTNGLFSNKPLLCIQAGTLTPPVFDADQLPCLNYAGFGFILAHELAHSIEFIAVNASSIMEHLKSKSKCLHLQYNDPERKADHEDLADNIGIQVAYNAYIAHLSNGNATASESDRRMFFIHFSQIWCEDGSSFSPDNAFHSPNKHRVNKPLTNFPVFSEVFGCVKGSAMNKEEKCSFSP